MFMGNLMQILLKLAERVNALFMVVGGAALIMMMAIACLNMGLRLIGRPISASYELVAFLSAIAVSFPLGYTQIQRSHVAVDILSRLFPAPLRKLVVSVSLFLAMIFFGVAAWKVWGQANTYRVSGELSETLRIPFYPFTYAVAVACGLMTFCLLVDLLRHILEKEDGAQ
jgi:TRAP-type C4-dicarboxylate transport system permease small subunit